MRVHPLYSSSSGNSCLIFTDTTQILLDIGVSWVSIGRAATIDLNINAIFISHDHGDHVLGAGVGGRKTRAPIYIPEVCYKRRAKLFSYCDVNFMEGGETVTIGNLEVKAFSTRHDSKNSLGYVIKNTDSGLKFGHITDTGSFSKLMKTALSDCDAYLIETDYDEKLLEETEEYDDILKDRIRCPWGHLGNEQAFAFIKEIVDLNKVQWIVFGHISSTSNSPELILTKAAEHFPNYKNLLSCAPTNEPLVIK